MPPSWLWWKTSEILLIDHLLSDSELYNWLDDNLADDWLTGPSVVCNNITKIDVSKLLLVSGRIEVVNNYQGNDPICSSFVCGIESVKQVPTQLLRFNLGIFSTCERRWSPHIKWVDYHNRKIFEIFFKNVSIKIFRNFNLSCRRFRKVIFFMMMF